MILIIFALIIALWYLGGQKSNRYRDVGVPILMGTGIWLATNSWFVGILSMGAWNVVRIGYGNFEPNDTKNSLLGDLTKDKQGAVIRAIYGLLVALVGSGALLGGKFLPLPMFFTYILGNTLIGYCVSIFRLPVLLTDILVSAGFASLLFLL